MNLIDYFIIGDTVWLHTKYNGKRVSTGVYRIIDIDLDLEIATVRNNYKNSVVSLHNMTKIRDCEHLKWEASVNIETTSGKKEVIF